MKKVIIYPRHKLYNRLNNLERVLSRGIDWFFGETNQCCYIDLQSYDNVYDFHQFRQLIKYLYNFYHDLQKCVLKCNVDFKDDTIYFTEMKESHYEYVTWFERFKNDNK